MRYTEEDFQPLTAAEFDELRSLLGGLLHTGELPLVIPGEAILGIEAMAAGIASEKRTVLNIVTGPYGKMFGSWLVRGGVHLVEITSPFDEVITEEAVSEAVEKYHPCLISFVQAEAITGGSNPTKQILAIARRNSILTAIDSVSAIGAEPMLMDEWGADFVAIGFQKALSGSNGISALGISARGWKFLEDNDNAPRNSILSLLDMRQMKDGIGSYRVPMNISVLEARALLDTLHAAAQEGLEHINRRHRIASESVIAAVQVLGLTPWQKNKSGYSPLDTTVRLPEYAAAGVIPAGIVTFGNGELQHKLLRINHYGFHACESSIEDAVKILARLVHTDPSAAVLAAKQVWTRENSRYE